jgi:hypothetical protein
MGELYPKEFERRPDREKGTEDDDAVAGPRELASAPAGARHVACVRIDPGAGRQPADQFVA